MKIINFSYTQEEVDKLCNYSFNVGKVKMLKEIIEKNILTLPQKIVLEIMLKDLENSIGGIK